MNAWDCWQAHELRQAQGTGGVHRPPRESASVGEATFQSRELSAVDVDPHGLQREQVGILLLALDPVEFLREDAGVLGAAHKGSEVHA